MSCEEKSSNYILQQNMTLTWWLLPAAEWNRQLCHIQQVCPSVQQVAALDFTTLSASRVGRQVRGSHDLDRSRMEEERSMYSSHKKPAFHECSSSVVGCLFSWSRLMWRDKSQGDALQMCSNASAVINSLHFRVNKSQTVRNNHDAPQPFQSEHAEVHRRTMSPCYFEICLA